ncbi:unnamed protein product [marine sediment metagenome]|uniref:Uncharacterized protein n=1 Tax=marine sediment metagenome TaxID=412755 RepID=X0S3W3_9ZZZZ
MGTQIITFDKITGEVESVKSISRPEDILLNIDQSKFDWLVVDKIPEHKDHWHYKNGKMVEKPQAIIDKLEADKLEAESQRRMPTYLKGDEDIMAEIMAEYLTELRTKAGIAGGVTAESIKAEVATRREQHRNPNKK